MSYLSNEELHLATRFLFLSMAMIVIQKDIQHIQEGAFKIKEPYLQLLSDMSTKATAERKQLRKKMYDKKMQVITIEKSEFFTSFLFLCQGREERRSYFNPAIRKKVEEIIKEFIQYQKGLQPTQDENPADI